MSLENENNTNQKSNHHYASLENTKILIIHGWDDSPQSFLGIKQRFMEDGFPDRDKIYFVKYDSKEDLLTVPMLADGLNDRLKEKGIIDEQGASNEDIYVIVHSTGALLIREWLNSYYDNAETCPVKKIVMLAPANFGSPWAHKGRSLLSRIVKGQNNPKNFGEVGELILQALELASPYQWKLSHQDLLCKNTFFQSNKIQTTILVGLEDNIDGFFNKLANKVALGEGTDNTVVIAGTALNPIKICLEYIQKGTDIEVIDHIEEAPTQTAFAVLPNTNHLNIRDRIINPADKAYEFFGKALTRSNEADFQVFRTELDRHNEASYAKLERDGDQKYKPYQLFIIHFVDSDGEAINDFYIDFSFFKLDDIPKEVKIFPANQAVEIPDLSQEINRELTREFHENRIDPSYRSFLVDINEANGLIAQAEQQYPQGVALTMQTRIESDLSQEKSIVLHRSNSGGKGEILSGKKFIHANTTTLIEIKVDRKIGREYVDISTNVN